MGNKDNHIMKLKEAREIHKNRAEFILVYTQEEIKANPSLLCMSKTQKQAAEILKEYNKHNPFIQFDMDGNEYPPK